MSESERRRKYHYNRVLIETERILTPEFSDAVVFLSGAQVEMLRNVTQYLARLDTYVTEYNPGYYLTPTVADYDDILEIVADLEETLMGNPNTIWGYKDVYAEITESTYDSTGVKQLQTDAVPEGYVYVITSVQGFFTSGTWSYASLTHETSLYSIRLTYNAAPVLNVPITKQCPLVLKEGETLSVLFNVSAQPSHCHLDVTGYKMVVP